MGEKLGEAWIEVRADGSKFDKDTQGLIGGPVKKLAGAVAAVWATDKAVDFAKDAIGAASDLSESLSKNKVIFGDYAAAIAKIGEGTAGAIGQSNAAFQESVGVMGNLLSSVGLTQQKSADMSVSLTTLASDLASFNNTSVEEAFGALRAGLVGETEPLKRFGVNLNEALLKQKAMEMGLYDGKGALDAAAKSQASYALIMEQTTLAQGDFARTSDGLANQQRILGAKFEDLKAKVGKALLPAMTSFVSFLADKGIPMLERFGAWFSEHIVPAIQATAEWVQRLVGVFQEGGLSAVLDEVGAKIQEMWPSIRAGLGVALQGLVTWFQEVSVPLLQAAGEVLQALGQWLLDTGLPALGAAAAAGAHWLWEWLKDVTPPALEQLGEWLAQLGAWFVNTALPKLGEWAASMADKLWEWIKDATPPMLEQIGEWLAQLGGWLVSTGLPKLAEFLAKMGLELVEWIARATPKAIAQIAVWMTDLTFWVLTTGVPKLVEAVAKLGAKLAQWIVDSGPETLLKMAVWLAEIGTWILTTGVPRLLEKAKDLGKALIDGMVDGIKNFVGNIFTEIEKMVTKIKDKIVGVINNVIGAWNKLQFKLPSYSGLEIAGRTVIPGWEGPSLGVPQIPPIKLARGGFTPGAGYAIVGEEGPELAYFGNQAKVYNASTTQGLLAALGIGRGGGVITAGSTGTGFGGSAGFGAFTQAVIDMVKQLMDGLRTEVREALEALRDETVKTFVDVSERVGEATARIKEALADAVEDFGREMASAAKEAFGQGKALAQAFVDDLGAADSGSGGGGGGGGDEPGGAAGGGSGGGKDLGPMKPTKPGRPGGTGTVDAPPAVTGPVVIPDLSPKPGLQPGPGGLPGKPGGRVVNNFISGVTVYGGRPFADEAAVLEYLGGVG